MRTPARPSAEPSPFPNSPFLLHGLAVYAVGALLGTIPLLLDWTLRSGALNRRSLAGFSLLGGAAAALSALVSIVFRRGRPWVEPAAYLFACFLALEILYLTNVALLPHHVAVAPISILWDLVAVALVSIGVWLASRVRTRLAPLLGPRALPLVGGGLLVGAIVQVVETWPVEPTIPHRQGSGPDLVVIVLDGARRDHLSLYGYGRATSPALDAWASSARVYERALAASSWTPDAVPAILGFQNGDLVRTPVLDRLKSKGYVVACFSDNPLFDRDGPLSKGFDHVGQSTAATPRLLRALFEGTFVGEHVVLWPWIARTWDDGRLVHEALRWSERVDAPFVLYVHLMDSHMPYRRVAIDGRSWGQRRLESPRSEMRLSPEEASDVVAHYDGGLRSADAAAGRLLDALAKRRRPYLAIVTADHGESLGEGERWGHGKTLAPELLAVPLLVVGQGVQPGRVQAPTGHASIAETLLRAAGLPGAIPGASDLRVSDGDLNIEGRLPPALSYRVANWYQVISDSLSGESGLFDIRRDPHREHDLSRLRPKLLQELAAGLSAGKPAPVDSAALDRLRALGYVDE